MLAQHHLVVTPNVDIQRHIKHITQCTRLYFGEPHILRCAAQVLKA